MRTEKQINEDCTITRYYLNDNLYSIIKEYTDGSSVQEKYINGIIHSRRINNLNNLKEEISYFNEAGDIIYIGIKYKECDNADEGFYEYDINHKIIHYYNNNGYEQWCTYDSHQNLIRVKDNVDTDEVFIYKYDMNDNLIYKRTEEEECYYSYDKNNRETYSKEESNEYGCIEHWYNNELITRSIINGEETIYGNTRTLD